MNGQAAANEITQSGEELYNEIIDCCIRTEKITSKYALYDYVYAGYKMIDNAYRTLIDHNPYMDNSEELVEIQKNCDDIINGLIAYKAEKEQGSNK